jgi:hypothetical protein
MAAFPSATEAGVPLAPPLLDASLEEVRTAMANLGADVAAIESGFLAEDAKRKDADAAAVAAVSAEEVLMTRVKARKRLVKRLRSIFVDGTAARPSDSGEPWLVCLTRELSDHWKADPPLKEALGRASGPAVLAAADEASEDTVKEAQTTNAPPPKPFVDETVEPTMWCVLSAFAAATANDLDERVRRLDGGDLAAGAPAPSSARVIESAADIAWSANDDRAVLPADWDAGLPPRAVVFVAEYVLAAVLEAAGGKRLGAWEENAGIAKSAVVRADPACQPDLCPKLFGLAGSP